MAADDDHKPERQAREDAARRGAGTPAGDAVARADAGGGVDDDSLEAIATRAMMEDAPPPKRPAKQPDGRRRAVAGAAAVDQILNAGPARQAASRPAKAPSGTASDTRPAAPRAQTRPQTPPAPQPQQQQPPAPQPQQQQSPAQQAPAPQKPVQQKPAQQPQQPRPQEKAAPPPSDDEPFDFEIPATPQSDDDARDLLIGGGSFEAPRAAAPNNEPQYEPEYEPEYQPGAGASASGEDDDPDGFMDDAPMEGPGWDDSPFDPEQEGPDTGPDTGADIAPETQSAEAAADQGAESSAPAQSATPPSSPPPPPTPQAAETPAETSTGPASASKAEKPPEGDLLDPKEAEGAHLDNGRERDDPNAGAGGRDLLSEQNLKEYLASLSADSDADDDDDEPASDDARADDGDGQQNDDVDSQPSAEDAMAESDAENPEAQADGVAAKEPGANKREGEERRAQPRDGDERRGEGKKRWKIRPSPGTKDDPLLGSLTILCTLLDRNISAEGLTAGLPLVDGMLTPELFVRAAQRAGISARLVRRPLQGIGKLALPCVLLLDQQRACVLTHLKRSEGKATIILPEMGAGAREVDYDELAQDYVGYALFARPEFQYDNRAQDTRIADPKGWFWGTIFGSWKLYVEVIVAAIMINAFVIANPLFVMNVYDHVVPNFAEETLWVLAIGILIVYAFDFLLKLLRAYLVDVAGKTSDTQIAARLFQQMLGMKMANRPPSAGGLASSLREFENLREFFTSSTMTTLIDLPFIFLFLAIISVIGTWKIVVIPAFIVLVVVLVGVAMQVPMQRIVRETMRESQQKNAIMIEAISGIETIKATGSEGRMQRSWETFVEKTARSAMLAHRWSSLAMTFSGTMMQVVTVAVVVVGVYEIQEGNMSVGALVACTILSGRALAPLSQIAGIATRFHQARQSLQALDGMMKTPVERPEGRSFVSRPSFHGNIEFKNVAFTYPDAKTQALNDVTFKIEAGEKIGVIGRIGSGKSTLERLILALYDPDEGSVLIDGTDTRQTDPADLRRAIGVVPQDVYLFWGTVRENIALGAPYADDQTILRAARIAGVDEFIARHPLGLDMPVGERGAQLSGGQRQAISVARALLLDPPILVLDEPTSAMDNTTEARFKARLGTILPNKTLILVTHRGSLLTLVDRLIVMDGGRVVADGPKDIVMEALNAGRIQTART